MGQLYYLDSIHLNKSVPEIVNAGPNGDEVQISLLATGNDSTRNEDIVINIPYSHLFFKNGGEVKENSFVYYDKESNQLENGNTSSTAKSNIRKAAHLRDRIKERSSTVQIEMPSMDDVSEVTSYHVNVGHGNCTIILIKRHFSNKIWMVDCGSTKYGDGYWFANVESCFDAIAARLNIGKDDLRIDMFMLTHAHADHYKGISKLFKRGYCDNMTSFFINLDYNVASDIYIDALTQIDKKGCVVKTPINTTGSIPPGFMKVLFPDKPVYKSGTRRAGAYISGKANDASAVYYFDFNRKSIMFPGDMGDREIEDFIASGLFCQPVKEVMYYCVSHHASITGHLDKKTCYFSKAVNCLDCCKMNLKRAIVMGKNKAFKGIYNKNVIKAFSPNVVYSEKCPKGLITKAMILEWSSGKCSYLL